jgi:phospholipid transport system substrate-binding protein
MAIGLLCAGLLAAARAGAEAGPPEALVKNVTEAVLTVLRQDKSLQAGDRRRAVAVIEGKVAPHFDFGRMTSLAVGRGWRQADAEQRRKLVAEFRRLLVHTYASALNAYRNETVSFKSAPPNRQGDEVVVRSQINKPGAPPIDLDYSLAKSGSDWKVFDVAIANVSLVTNYRSSFASEVEKGGIDGLLRSLRERNERLQAAG